MFNFKNIFKGFFLLNFIFLFQIFCGTDFYDRQSRGIHIINNTNHDISIYGFNKLIGKRTKKCLIIERLNPGEKCFVPKSKKILVELIDLDHVEGIYFVWKSSLNCDEWYDFIDLARDSFDLEIHGEPMIFEMDDIEE